ncbi:TPA: RHS repeat protein, partial [Burkholderia contaminans]|nr:RHS repeat protein [Burkholderia contaminans]
MASQAPEPSASSARPITVAPLNQIQLGDVALTIGAFDQWLGAITDGAVTLDRLRTVAGNLPAVRNILNLADLLGDIVTLTTREDRDTSDWAIAGINLIGLMPAPLSAARMTLRPTLFLARQELTDEKSLVSEALLNTLAVNLNNGIQGPLDDFVEKAKQRLPGLLEEAATFGETLMLDLASGLEALVQVSDVVGMSPGKSESGKSWHDPTEVFSNLYDAALQFQRDAASTSQSAPAQNPSKETRAKMAANAQLLRQFAALLTRQVRAQANPATQGSVGWIVAGLHRSLEARGPGRPLAANVKTDTTSKGEQFHPGGSLEVRVKERPAEQDASACKNCAPTGTGSNISFATGSETLSQTDFTLSGPFPISWTRTYCSSLGAYDGRELGARWITPYTTRIDMVGKGLRYHGADGRSHDYPLPKIGTVHEDLSENLILVRVSEHRLHLRRGHERCETYHRHGDHFLLMHIELRGDAGLLLGYDRHESGRAVLSDLVTYQDDPTQQHLHLRTDMDEGGRLIGLWLMRGEKAERRLSLYHYDEAGDLTLAQDENAQVWTYQYQHHLITHYTDRTGRGMNLQWEGDGPNARAVREWADDGSFDTRLRWDENLRLTYATDAHGQETRHYYDHLGYTYRI